MVKLADLTPAERRQIGAGKVQVASPGGPRPAARRGGVRGLARHRCVRCSSVFPHYLTAERHVDEVHRSGRIEMVLG